MVRFSFFTAGAFAANVMAQANSAQFVNTTWDTVHVGQIWPIQWSPGDGSPVSLFLVNSTWISNIFVNRPVVPSLYEWNISAPTGIWPGSYSLGLSQNGEVVYSPRFDIEAASDDDGITTTITTTVTPTPTGFPSTTPTVNATLISVTPDATVTVTYWDESCGCKKKTVVPAATASNVPGGTYTWYDSACGCTKSAVVPAPTFTTSCYNWTAPPAPSRSWADWNSTPVAPTPVGQEYTGDATKLFESGFGLIVLVAAAILL
ncbi:hypothetical protein PV10_02158 [Exophiala mesophila]|uniref:Uncharacterized protein n=1 Tax=Exophiala mesophila TaxID=212818 RepID=A0A0D1Y1F7_EXOME|nr:uncharacterized protein PV10_02158 [Exophiala mesophila]KIV94386.1 hypothetical protein PV10_02158 [Exophiala mesophila]